MAGAGCVGGAVVAGALIRFEWLRGRSQKGMGQIKAPVDAAEIERVLSADGLSWRILDRWQQPMPEAPRTE